MIRNMLEEFLICSSSILTRDSLLNDLGTRIIRYKEAWNER